MLATVLPSEWAWLESGIFSQPSVSSSAPCTRLRSFASSQCRVKRSMQTFGRMSPNAMASVIRSERDFFAAFRFVIRTVYTTPQLRVQSVPREALDADLRKNEPERHGERNPI